MIVNIDAQALRRFLEQSDDAEAIGEGEYTVDLYETDPPMSLDLSIEKGKVSVLAALELKYSEEEDGWYLGERLEDAALIANALNTCLKAQ